MTTINPINAQSATLLRRAGFTAPTTDQLRALVARRVGQPGIDAANLSGSTRAATGLASIGDTRQGLGEVAGLLDQLKNHVNKLASGGATADDAQQAIDDLVSSIGDAAQRTGLADHGGDGFGVLDVAKQVTNLSVYGVHMQPGQEQKVDIDVRASAQQAGLFMDLKDGKLNLAAATSEFQIEVAGRNGTADFSFHNGDSADDIAKAINAQSKDTGIEARVSGSGVRLESIATGSAEFTSLRVLDDGGATDDAGHIFRLKADDAGAADPDSFMTFDSIVAHSGSGVRDKGQDAEVWVNGQKAAVYGSEVLATNKSFTAMFYLDKLPGAGPSTSSATAAGPDAQRLGKFTGFTIKANGEIGPGGDPGATPNSGGTNDVDPKSAGGDDGVNIQPPPELDYGSNPNAGPGDPDAGDPSLGDGKSHTRSSDSASGAGSDVNIQPPPPKDYGQGPAPTSDGTTPTDPTSAAPVKPVDDNGGGKRGGDGGDKTPLDDVKAAAGGGSAIDPSTVRVAIDKLLDRIKTQSSALDLIEKAGLDVVPASVRGTVGISTPDQPGLDYGSALDIAKGIRQSVFSASGSLGDFAGGTTSAQVLRLLGADGLR